MGEAIVKVSQGLLEQVLFHNQVRVVRVLIQDDDEVALWVIRFVIAGPKLPKRSKTGDLEEVVAVFKKVCEHTEVSFTPVER